MKFADGCWLTQKDYEVHNMSGAYEVLSHDAHSITILATGSRIYNRGMTLGGPVLRITYSSFAENIIGVKMVHYPDDGVKRPEFELERDKGYIPEITIGDDTAVLVSGKTRVEIKLHSDWQIDYFYGDRKLTSSRGRTTSYIVNDRHGTDGGFNPRFFEAIPEHPSYLREQLSLGVGECVYGFGEKFTHFVKNGQTVDMWNSDGGTSSYQSYKCVPFFLTSGGWGVFVNSSGNVSFEAGSDVVSKISFTLPGEEMEYFLIGGAEPKDVLRSYTSLTGRAPLVPRYTFGLWLSTSFTTDYSEETVNSFIDGMEKRGIPLQVFHFDCFWMREFRWCDFEWDRRQFPDPAAMLKRLRDRGLSVCVWINPYISGLSTLSDEASREGYLLKNRNGGIFRTDFWQPGMAIVDFTNPAARDWFRHKITELLKMGVTNIKTDFGERIPTDVVYYDGSDPELMHNMYTYLYNKTVYEALTDFYGKDKACLFARSATAGSQRFPVHWGGDCTAEYSSMAETLRGGLSLGLSGFGYFSHDIGGFEATASPDVYKRWAAFGLMSSHSRLHGSTSYRVPWLFDEESVDVLRFFTCLKGKLMPYIWSQAVAAAREGLPVMRAMLLEFPEDRVCRTLDTQYMFGDSLLAAPVFDESGEADVWLPEGRWHDVITGKAYDGGHYERFVCTHMEMPLLAREGRIIAWGNFERNFDYDYLDGTVFRVYNLPEGKTAEARIYDGEGREYFVLTAKNEGGVVTWTSTPTDKRFGVEVIFD